MRRICQLGFALAAVLAAAFPAAPAGFAAAEGHIVITESNGAGAKMDRRRVASIVDQVCAELHRDKSAMPETVFIHLSDDEARAGGVPGATTVMVERSSLSVEQKREGAPERFLVWLVGEPDDSKVVGAVAHVLRLHLRLDISDADLLIAEKRIARRVGATVNVNAFRK